MKNLDEKDKTILEMLIEDSRRPYHEIAKVVDLSESTVRKRVIRLQEDGVIEKFTIKVCREEERCIYAFITLLPKNQSEIKELIRETQILPQCEEVYFLAGECGILVKVNVPEITELDAFIENFRGRSDVRSVERVCVVLKTLSQKTRNGGVPF